MKTNQVKVKKNIGDFNRALKEGFAVNLYDCDENEMWLVMPDSVSKETLISMAEQKQFVVVG